MRGSRALCGAHVRSGAVRRAIERTQGYPVATGLLAKPLALCISGLHAGTAKVVVKVRKRLSYVCLLVILFFLRERDSGLGGPTATCGLSVVLRQTV
jgi:hypothetical protein